MKKHNIALTLLMVLGVAACGSSGGSSDSAPKHNSNSNVSSEVKTNQTSNDTAPIVTPAPQVDKAPTVDSNKPVSNPNPALNEKEQVNSPYTQNKAVVGSGYIVPKVEGMVQNLNLSSESEGAFGILSIDGKNVPLIPSNSFNSNYITINSGNMIRKVDKQNYTIWGLVWEKGLDKQYLTAIGKQATKEMPTNGVYTYKGSAIQFSGNDKMLDVNSAEHIRNAEFTVDFDRKVFAGVIPQQDANNPILLSADITKNTFFGEANGIKTQGGFFGPQASELTGDYLKQDAKEIKIGVFGAKKQ
ncbi:transferrin-binding protein-like solute binding protein [Actinobacillus equuli]|uniref:transferrin-binding protein-like solute binding protein n=1 Tax=Actinobacillus equuli TaxID=718 RepID=UPI002418B0C1|nr:transferrin-binding protein-like solute binding protein [Actinobacillus equuli]MDG4952952.1 transferrin-binding protein-like solute binding protein [Actinobacillus equuli subsp. equuli]